MSNAKISMAAAVDSSLQDAIPAASTYDPSSKGATRPIAGAPLDSFSTPTVTSKGQEELDDILAQEYAKKDLPGVFFGATTAHGTIYQNQLGKVDYDSPDEETQRMINEDTIIHIFSMTKFITSLAALQIVERGLVTLDEPVDHLLPEIAVGKLPILKGYKGEGKGQEIYEEATNPITLRMLLTHNAGLSYPFTHPELARWKEENGFEALADMKKNATVKSYVQPLAYNPGTSWRYSIGLDWAGVLIERLTKLSLEDYFIENIFKPCGMDSTTFYPYPWVRERLMRACIRDANRKVKIIKGPVLGKPEKPEDVGQLGGGGGLYGTVKDYLRLLQHILASHPANPDKPAKPFLSERLFKEIFTGSLPAEEGGNTARSGLAAFMRSEAYPKPDPQTETVQHSCGLSLNLVDSKWGRKAGSGCWAGAAKSQFWIDPTTGIGGVCATQLFAANPDEWTYCYNKFERTLYSNLA